MHQGEFVPAPCCPLWGKCRDSGKGGGVGDFELLPFIEQHPLSQPCRFRSAVKSASSPIGEPSGLLRIRPGFHKGMSAYRETPLRLAKSRLTAVARLHSACGHLSQPVRAASSPIGEPRAVQPPLKGLAGVAVLDGVQLLNAKLRTARLRRRGFRRYAEYHLKCTKANSYQPLAAPFGGSAAQRQRGCRWYF